MSKRKNNHGSNSFFLLLGFLISLLTNGANLLNTTRDWKIKGCRIKEILNYTL